MCRRIRRLAHAIAHNKVGGDPRYTGLLAWSGFDYHSGFSTGFQGREVLRPGGHLPHPQAGGGHLPVPGRPPPAPGHRARLLLRPGAGVAPGAGGPGHGLFQLRAGGGLPGRRARRHAVAGPATASPTLPTRLRSSTWSSAPAGPSCAWTVTWANTWPSPAVSPRPPTGTSCTLQADDTELVADGGGPDPGRVRRRRPLRRPPALCGRRGHLRPGRPGRAHRRQPLRLRRRRRGRGGRPAPWPASPARSASRPPTSASAPQR